MLARLAAAPALPPPAAPADLHGDPLPARESRALLAAYGGGAPEALRTREARAALGRLGEARKALTRAAGAGRNRRPAI